jgi:hypothetical protein
MNNYAFIADFFSEDMISPGGAELNNDELIKIFNSKKIDIHRVRSCDLDLTSLQKKNTEKIFYIIANFINLKKECKDYLQQVGKYAIYEHDHKYLVTRNPADYPNFEAPQKQIINYNFYKNAKAVLCQSSFHKDIICKNLKLDNIVSVGGNLWSEETLQMLEKYSFKKKQNVCSIMDSPIPHKNTAKAIAYCRYKKMPYELIKSADYHTFLDKLSNNDKLVFFPETPETLSRIIVECRMMNMKVITNNLIGATYEPWFKVKGAELIEIMLQKRNQIYDIVIGLNH